ncbi:MAG: translation initiation factor IF-2 [SAR202 cluster bacterium]|nr:translation initiation factor IF-2 [SAR202 cluster bacterium]
MTSRSRRSGQGSTATTEHSREDIAASIQAQGMRPLDVPAAISVHDLAEIMDVGAVEIIKDLMRNGHMYTINEVMEHDVAAMVAPSFGFGVLPLAERDTGPASLVLSADLEDQDKLEARPPVITILGHVDHGKTTLLDRIRNTKVVDGEAGGITQHIGAYQIDYDGTTLTFLDTPGHAAFTAMRARGAQVTDIAVLVVAADDGIMPQTIEAISHARAAEVPIVVAINKIDSPSADIDRVKRQLAEQNLLIEDWGGDVISVEVSALTGTGVPDLLENLVVTAEVSEFKANPERTAKGVVVEARRENARGTVATLLVQTGTLNLGDNLVVGGIHGRVKAMFSDRRNKVETAGPSRPIEMLGLNELPEAGQIFEAVVDEKTARQMVTLHEREVQVERAAGPTLEDVHTRMQIGEVKSLNLIIKTDVQGTVEAVRGALEKLNSEETKVNIVHAASGFITESDVMLAVASKAIILGFNSQPQPGARALAGAEGVEIRDYDVIYHLTEDVENALEGMLEPIYEDVLEGRATVRAVFNLGRRAKVAGIYVNDGTITRSATIRVLRGGSEIVSGAVASLKHFRDDVREVATGFEGGLTVEGFVDFEDGDIIEAYRSERVR